MRDHHKLNSKSAVFLHTMGQPVPATTSIRPQAAAGERPAEWNASVHPLSQPRPPIPMPNGAESSMLHPGPQWQQQHCEQSMDDSRIVFPGANNNPAGNLSIGVDNTVPRHSTPHSRNKELPNLRRSPGVRFASLPRSETGNPGTNTQPQDPTTNTNGGNLPNPTTIPTPNVDNEPALPHSAQFTHSSDPRPAFFRPDPLTDRAIAAATKCRHLAFATMEVLMPCEYLLQVTQSAESCNTLHTHFASLAVLVLPPKHLHHVCAPLGHCEHEAWHQRHVGKLEGLVRRLDKFLADFAAHPETPDPRTTSELAKKLADYAKQFAEIQNSIQVHSVLRSVFARQHYNYAFLLAFVDPTGNRHHGRRVSGLPPRN
ncbi:hypothetical protein C8F04DRAFT_624626 [Mycena alexandri]|uniref:Uncharacterized protein n=1 Tax=Mycena alexandri TaxID=1745969 RepID=A0AAD6STK7_9AGAR|nr:hypothetical protein C8F04DRAFT_624626 [Mycena alexandri]